MPPQRRNMREQGRRWVFTWNNYPDTAIEAVKAWAGPDGPCKYVMFQAEQGAQGTPHLQGWVTFESPKRRSFVEKRLMDDQPLFYWAKMKGSPADNARYCSKSATCVDGPWMEGTAPAQGKRSDLDAVKADLDAGLPMTEIANKHFGTFLRMHRGLLAYQTLRLKPRNYQTFCEVIWGPSNFGKSSYCAKKYPNAFWLPQPRNNDGVWFDGYDPRIHPVLIVDEFYGWMQRALMQRLCDPNPLMVQTKGGQVQFLAERVVITSNQDPEEWWRIGLGEPMRNRMSGTRGSCTHVTSPMWEMPCWPQEELSAIAPTVVLSDDDTDEGTRASQLSVPVAPSTPQLGELFELDL